MDQIRDLARFFKALGDETRLSLVALLAQQEPGHAMCVGRLAHELGVTASAISQHLRVLKDLGLVLCERRGYHLHYFVDSERLAAYQDRVRQQLGEEFVVRERAANPSQEEVSTMCCRDSKAEHCHLDEKRDPQECSPEQIRECHGEVTEHPCENKAEEKAECCHLDKKRDPQECSPEQIRECHGEVTEHVCEHLAEEK